MKSFYCALILVSLLTVACNQGYKPNYTQWEEYLGGPERNQYSELSQITLDNVTQLEVAWTYSLPDSGQMQMNPIIVDGILYGVSPTVQAFAVDASSGKEIWRYGDKVKVWHSTSRGLAYWEKGDDKRILYTIGPDLIALDALTGEPVISFGDSGKVDLHAGMAEKHKENFVISNTPGTIFENLIIMPYRVHEGPGSPPGDIKAYNVITGKMEWIFHTIPHPGEEGYETWPEGSYESGEVGSANNWSGSTLDRETGIIYIPTGSASPDFWGGSRIGDNLFANTLLALDARTGKKIWHQQLVHHDLLDRDLPAPPNLITVKRNGKRIKAISQTTKQGYVYVFDRASGEPLFEINEVPTPASQLIGERASETQPIPARPQPFARMSSDLTEEDLSPYAPDRDQLMELFNKSDKREYAPPSLDPVFLLPGYDGAAEWGGAAADPENGILYVNSNEMAWILQMEEVEQEFIPRDLGEQVYIDHCSSCHGINRKGNAQSGYPDLNTVFERLDRTEVESRVEAGKGMMPGFSHLAEEELGSVVNYLAGIKNRKTTADDLPDSAPKYRHTGYTKFLDSNGLPGISPPWGTMTAIDLNSGEHLWQIPLGETDSLKALGYPQTGTENYGGPLVTENGLLFIAATKDGNMRAYNRHTGELLWEYKLPAAAFATPSTYMIDGKQYLVIACGGEKLGTKPGNKIVAFALN